MSKQQPQKQTAYTEMQLAMLSGMVNCSLNGSDIWQRIPCRGDYPTPEELIAWAAAEAVQRLLCNGGNRRRTAGLPRLYR